MVVVTSIEHALTGMARPGLAFGIALASVLGIRQAILHWIRRQAKTSEFYSAVAETVGVPSLLWALAAAGSIGLEFAGLNQKHVQFVEACVVAFVVFSLALAGSSIVIRMAAEYGRRRNLPSAASGLLRAIVRVVFISFGVVVALHALGREHIITPLITALGVSGLALALALQDTLGNFFAGIHILMEEPISVGDMISLSSGETGTVYDIGWRTTRVLTGQNNIIVIPNTKITSSILTNFTMPASRCSVTVRIVAGLGADVDQVMNIILDEARQTANVLADPAPVVLFDPGVTPTHMEFTLVFHVASLPLAGGAQSAVRLRVLSRFRGEGVPLPAPGTIKAVLAGAPEP